MLWIAETARRMYQNYGIPITELDDMDPRMVEELDKITRMRLMAESNARATADLNKPG